MATEAASIARHALATASIEKTEVINFTFCAAPFSLIYLRGLCTVLKEQDAQYSLQGAEFKKSLDDTVQSTAAVEDHSCY